MIPLFYPPKQNVERMVKELTDTLKGRWWGQGPKVDEFERQFCQKFGFEYCVMVNSGTAALHLAYILAGIKSGNRVVVPVLTCTATCHPLKLMGAEIAFADIQEKTLTLDYDDLSRIRQEGQIKAIVTVHLGGLVDRPHMIKNMKSCYEVPIIEDAAQALGAPGLGMADYTCFSFQAIKGLSTGDGGMLVVKTEKDYLRAKRLRWFSIDREEKIRKNWQAWDRRGITFDQREVGYKYQATDIDASIGLAALHDFDGNQGHRRRLVGLYRDLLSESNLVDLLDAGDHNSHWLFMVLVKGNKRNDLADVLAKAGVETNVAHIRNDLFSVFGGKRNKLPGMRAVEKRYLCLPLNNQVTEKGVRYICKTILEAKI